MIRGVNGNCVYVVNVEKGGVVQPKLEIFGSVPDHFSRPRIPSHWLLHIPALAHAELPHPHHRFTTTQSPPPPHTTHRVNRPNQPIPLHQASIIAFPTSTLALPFRFRSLFLAIFLFTSIYAILASTRLGPRLTSLFHQIRPLIYTPQIPSFRPILTSTMAPSKYQKPPQAPPLFTATPTSVVEEAKALCDTTRSLLDKIAKEVTPETATFANVVLPMAEDENAAGLKGRLLGFYQAVSGDSKLRDASSKAEEIMDEFNIEASMREDIFKLVDAAYNKKESLDPESQRLLEKERKSYIRNGLGIEKGEKRDRFKEIKKRLSMIQIEFQKNLNEENGGIWFTKKELEGVPQDTLDTFEKGTGDNEGKLRFSFKYPDLFPTLKFALDPETRKKVFIENENKVCFQFRTLGKLG